MLKKIFNKLFKKSKLRRPRLFVGEIIKGYGVHIEEKEDKTELNEYFSDLKGLYRYDEITLYKRQESLQSQGFYR